MNLQHEVERWIPEALLASSLTRRWAWERETTMSWSCSSRVHWRAPKCYQAKNGRLHQTAVYRLGLCRAIPQAPGLDSQQHCHHFQVLVFSGRLNVYG